MAILSKVYKQDNFEQHNSLKLSFTIIWCLHSSFLECESFLETNSSDILALWETNMDDYVDYGNFSVRDYLLLIRKDSIAHMHGPAVYVKEGLPFALGLSCNSWFMVTWFILYLWFIKLETSWMLDSRNVSPYLQCTVWHLQIPNCKKIEEVHFWD